MMKVSDLIEKLKALPQDLPVVRLSDEWPGTVFDAVGRGQEPRVIRVKRETQNDGCYSMLNADGASRGTDKVEGAAIDVVLLEGSL